MLPSAADLTAQPVHALLERRIVVRLRVMKRIPHARAKDQDQPAVRLVTILHKQGDHVDTEATTAAASAEEAIESRQREPSPLLVAVVGFQPTVSALLVAPAHPVQHPLRPLHRVRHSAHRNSLDERRLGHAVLLTHP